MNGKELFLSRTPNDIKEMAKHLYKEHTGDYTSIGDVENEIYYFLDIIKDVKFVKEKEDEDFLVICKEVKDDFAEEIIKKEDGKIDFEKIPGYFCVDGVHLKEILEKRDMLDMPYKQSKDSKMPTITKYGIEFVERNKLLAFEIMDLCFEKYDMNTIAAEIYFEYTFNGVTQESQDERREHLENSKKELDELLKIVKEHPEKENEFFVSKKEVFSDLLDEDEKFDEQMEICEEFMEYEYIDQNKFFKEYLEKYKDTQIARILNNEEIER